MPLVKHPGPCTGGDSVYTLLSDVAYLRGCRTCSNTGPVHGKGPLLLMLAHTEMGSVHAVKGGWKKADGHKHDHNSDHSETFSAAKHTHIIGSGPGPYTPPGGPPLRGTVGSTKDH